MKYRKKPVVIEAIQLKCELFQETILYNAAQIHEFCPKLKIGMHGPYIETLEGNMSVSPGDYIIKGVKGEFYPCKPDIFEMTYEAVED